MCVLPVGMAEVSTCEITVREGQRVRKGDEIGMFHFGGSTHCLIFRPGVNLEFDHHGQKPGLSSRNIHVNASIATVRKN
jgi:phosphatidylserine decarboxylase